MLSRPASIWRSSPNPLGAASAGRASREDAPAAAVAARKERRSRFMARYCGLRNRWIALFLTDRSKTSPIRFMARPSEFDRNEVLHRAMEVFWCQGFEATGMPHLVEAMGIGRQSLYNAFESKRGLFLEALRLYQSERSKSLQKVL